MAAARRLGDAVRAPNGKEEDAVAASLRGGPPRAFLEAEGTEEGEAEGVDGKYGEVCEAGLFRSPTPPRMMPFHGDASMGSPL